MGTELSDNWQDPDRQSTPDEEGSQDENQPEESKFNYSLDDDCTAQIPEFMKNDLKAIAAKEETPLKTNKKGHIRRSLYFVFYRALRFGLDPTASFILEECHLLEQLSKDL